MNTVTGTHLTTAAHSPVCLSQLQLVSTLAIWLNDSMSAWRPVSRSIPTLTDLTWPNDVQFY